MYLENLVIDALEPQRLGRFWEAALGGDRLTDEADGFETRLAIDGGPVLDLCFPRVPEPAVERQRLHLDLAGGSRQSQVIERLLGLGASHLHISPCEVTSAVLADPEGNAFCVTEDRAVDAEIGPVAALRLSCAQPDRDAEFWSWLSGWTDAAGGPLRSLRHPSTLRPFLVLSPEAAPKAITKNRSHLDIRLETGDEPNAVAAGIEERGGRELRPEWGPVPWRLYADPSGNEFCVLPARAVVDSP